MSDINDRNPAIRTIAMPTDSNPYGSMFGGWIMGQMAQAGGALAARHSKCKSVVVGADELRFEHPVRVGDELTVYADFEKLGRSSMTVKVEAYRRDRHEDQMMMAASGRYTFVAVDENNEPAEIPELPI